MKVLMILGSRNPQGQTATAADALLEGVGQGHRSETSPNTSASVRRRSPDRGEGRQSEISPNTSASVRQRSPDRGEGRQSEISPNTSASVRRRSPDRGEGRQSEISPNTVEVERVFLPEVAVERCRQCEDNGWGICRTEGCCVIEDDFAVLVEKIREADAVAFATPVYFSDLSESMRAFLDRLRRISRHDDGQRGIEGKRAVGICVAGGGGGGAPECTVSLKKILRTSGFDVVDMIPVRRQNLDMKVDVLKTVGAWFTSNNG
jgi:multimeric flavodoxin WrbA